MSRRFISLGVCVALLTLASAASAEKKKAAVLGIETRGAQNQQLVLVGKLMTAKLRAEVAKPKSPYGLSDVLEDFLTIKIMHDCPGAAYPCMSRITKNVLKAKYSIYGTVEEDSRGYVFKLTLLNAETEQPEGQLTEVVPLADAPDDAKAAKYAKGIYNKLLGRSEEGKLVVRSNVDAGRVFIDGKEVGNLADGVVVVPNVEPGEHEVSVDSDGQTAKASVKVLAGEASEVLLTVVKGPGPGPGPGGGGGGSNVGWQVAFYAGAIGTVGLGILGFIEYNRLGDDGHYAKKVREANEALPNPITTPNMDDDVCDSSMVNAEGFETVKKACDDGKSGALRANIGGFGAAVLGVATLIFAYKAFLSDNGSSTERNDLSLRRKRKEPRVRIIPGGPGDIGAGLEVTF